MQTIRLLAEKGVNTEENLLEAAKTANYDYSFIDNSSEDVSRLEGYLFPDTYEFYKNHNAKSALGKLIDAFADHFDEDAYADSKAKAMGYSVKDVVTIASLIEKETDGTDQANIASVIYNRLQNKGETVGLLQIDAALLYGLPDHTGALTNEDKAVDLSLIHILLMDVGVGAGGGLPPAHHLLRDLRGHIQIDHQIWLRQPQKPVLRVK